jgi:DNA-binding MarR family transcriptional regulator
MGRSAGQGSCAWCGQLAASGDNGDGWSELADTVARLRRALRRGVRRALPAQALSVAQIEVLQAIADGPGLRSTDLGERLSLAPTTVSTLLSPLLAKELVARDADPGDRRVYRLSLTPAGADALAVWQHTTMHVIVAAFVQLTADDRRAIRRAVPALDRLVDRLG